MLPLELRTPPAARAEPPMGVVGGGQGTTAPFLLWHGPGGARIRLRSPLRHSPSTRAH